MALTTLRHAAMPTGSVLQVVQTALTSAVTVSSPTSFSDISGLSVAITPKFSNSKVLIEVFLVGEAHTADFHAVFRLLRGSTAIGVGDANGTAPRASFMIDSYGQGSLHYKRYNIQNASTGSQWYR
jgi:hypothetical protein